MNIELVLWDIVFILMYNLILIDMIRNNLLKKELIIFNIVWVK